MINKFNQIRVTKLLNFHNFTTEWNRFQRYSINFLNQYKEHLSIPNISSVWPDNLQKNEKTHKVL